MDLQTLIIKNVDMDTLQEQYVRLQEVIAFVEPMRVWDKNIPDASILDGIVEMLGDVLPTMDEFLCEVCGSWDDSLTPEDMVCESCKDEASESIANIMRGRG